MALARYGRVSSPWIMSAMSCETTCSVLFCPRQQCDYRFVATDVGLYRKRTVLMIRRHHINRCCESRGV